jgi:hypothetical protein
VEEQVEVILVEQMMVEEVEQEDIELLFQVDQH